MNSSNEDRQFPLKLAFSKLAIIEKIYGVSVVRKYHCMLLARHNLSIGSIIISLVFLCFIYCLQYVILVSGDLTPFHRQEIKDGILESTFLNKGISPELSATQRETYDNPLDVLGVSHFTDGKNINATLWINGSRMKDHSQIGVRELEYGAVVDTDNSQTTGMFDVDFQRRIKSTNDTNNWTNTFIEYSSTGLHNIVSETSNLTNFKDKSAFPLSIDLNSVTSPSKFRIAYYTIATYNDSSKIIDITSWIDVPPAEFSLSSSENPLVLTKGETLDIGAQLVSNTGISPRVLNFNPEHNQSWITIEFNPKRHNLSSFSVGAVPFRISVAQDAEPGKYIIPIQGNVSMESSTLGVPSVNASILGKSFFTIRPNLTVTVVNPPSFEDDFKEFWSSYGQVISLFGAGFLGAFSSHLIDIVRERKKEKKQMRT